MPVERINLHGHVVPKARPRYDPRRGRGYTEPRYRDWLEDAANQVAIQTTRNGKHESHFYVEMHIGKELTTVYLKPQGPIRPKGVQGDIDNISGAVLDSLQHGGAIEDDKLAVELYAVFMEDQ